MESRTCRLHQVHDIRIESELVPEIGPHDVQVAMGRGGICGSDLHYFHDGGIGHVRVREAFIVGHEAAGHIIAVGTKVNGLVQGDLVAINPSLHCGACRFCKRREWNHCLRMRFMGSIANMPHDHGLFRDIVTVPAVRAHRLASSVPVAAAACTEPLAVCLHAVSQAPDLHGRRILIMGAGPIGCLMTGVAAMKTPAELIVTDLHDFPLSVAEKFGADRAINVAAHSDHLAPLSDEKGRCDVIFECTGSGAALQAALGMIRPHGTVVLVGMAGEVPLPLNQVVSKEIRLVGTQRFHAEFADAAHMIDTGRIDVMPIVTQTYELNDALAAFEQAGDRTCSLKVQLRLGKNDGQGVA
ncbi:MAG: L-idonate 5-dehydrogenase [Rhodobacteraceae bacterium]|nr:L-idonate 5-dehydrogenase [Paracoccaceae bacterium]